MSTAPGSGTRRRLVRTLLLLLVYFTSGMLGLYFPTQDSHITLFWLPTGIALAALLRWGWRDSLPGIYLGALLVDLALGTSPPLSLLGAAGNTLAPLTAAWLLQRWRFDPSFARQYDLTVLIAAAALATLLPGLVGVGILWLGDLLSAQHMPLAWLHWWLGDMVSILLAAPLLLSVSRDSLRELRQRPVELLSCGLLLCLAAWITFFSQPVDHALPLAFIPAPFVLWAALRLGVTGSTLAVLLLSLLTALGTALGRGVFGMLPGNEGMYMAWLYMFTIALIGLMVTTMLGERNRTAASLQRANDLLALAQRVARAGVWDWDLASGELTWSDEMFRLFGLNPRTANASFDTWRRTIHPDDLQQAEARIETAVRDGTPLFNEYRILLPDGRIRWINALGDTTRDQDNRATHLSGLCIDVTAQKEAQQRARRSETRYKALIQQAASALYVHDMNGNIVETNQQACDALQYTREELLRLNVADISRDFDPHKARELWDRLAPNQPQTIISAHRRKDGSVIPVEVRFAVLEVDDERLVMALASDITQRVQDEQRLLDSLHKLEEKELAKTRFLAAAGHDLRQPVAAASLFLDALKLTSLSPRQQELTQRLDQSMSTFSSLLERLLDISRFDAGLIRPRIEPVSLTEVFNWLDQQFSEAVEQKGLQFRFYLPLHKALVVRADIGLLQSMLMNLIGNALKYTERGGLLVAARPRGGRILLQVWDTGIGISEENLDYIFDEFFQVANPQRNRKAGLGLGLSICQRAASLLDTRVSCRSRLGLGSVFEFSLPYSRQTDRSALPPPARSPEAPPDRSLLQNKRIVIVEDDTLVAAGLLSLLQGLGAEVRLFHDGETALHADVLRTDHFIVDYALGGKLTGLELLDRLQQRAAAPLRGLLLTGETSSQFIHRTANSPWPVLHKPVNYATLLDTLHALEQSAVRPD